MSAKHLNGLFLIELKRFEYFKKFENILKKKIKRILENKLEDCFREQAWLKKQITTIREKMEKLENRFIEGDVNKDLFEKYTSKYEEEQKELEQKLSNQTINSSNLEKIIEKGLGIAENLSHLWASSDYDDKRKLQSLIFPEGIVYCKKKDRVRTLRVNSLFAETPDLVSDLSGNKNGQAAKTSRNSRRVKDLRIERL